MFADYLKGAAKYHLNTFGQQVIFNPSGGIPRTILAIVDHFGGRPVSAGKGAGFLLPKRIIQVANRSTSILDDGVGGIDADALNSKGADTITLPRRPGSSVTETLGIYIPDDQKLGDEGMIMLYLS